MRRLAPGKSPKMTRAHFELIANTIRNMPIGKQTRKKIAKQFASNLCATNPQFQSAKFIQVCLAA